MSSFFIIKNIHVACAVISICGFVLRGIWMARSSGLLHNRWIKRLPHVVDSLLLLTAFIMLYQLQMNPFAHPWLATKIVLLLVYILLGMVALHWGPSRNSRVVAWLLAIMVFMFMVSVAIAKSGYGIMTYF